MISTSTTKKVLLCIWWDQHGILYYELLQPDETVTDEQQLVQLHNQLVVKRPEWSDRHDKVVLLHDNARPHITQPVKNTFEDLKKSNEKSYCPRCTRQISPRRIITFSGQWLMV